MPPKRLRCRVKNRLEQREAVFEAVNALAGAIEARDPYTRGHSERVATYAVWLAEKAGLNIRKVRLLRHCCRLHDLGKIRIPDVVLLKPGRLTLEERAQIEQHPMYGSEMLSGLRCLRAGLPIILHHHERYDGHGYPYGLKRDEIPVEVRVITIADAFDAMTSDRPYRKALPMDAVILELNNHSGKQFDPHLVSVFLRIIEDKIEKRAA